MSEWRLLKASQEAKINLPMTLMGGQCFRWRKTPRNTYIGVVQHYAYELREQGGGSSYNGEHRENTTSNNAPPLWFETGAVEYRRLHPPPQNGSEYNDEGFLSTYLSLDVHLPELWKRWTAANPMKHHPLAQHLLATRFGSEEMPLRSGGDGDASPPLDMCTPIRHLRQDIHETLFAFICSQNNNVSRISMLVDRLASQYGTHLCDVNLITGAVQQAPSDAAALPPPKKKKTSSSSSLKRQRGQGSPLEESKAVSSRDEKEWVRLSSFPSAEQLGRADEATLRQLGFGYRSPYIESAVKTILNDRHNLGPLHSGRAISLKDSVARSPHHAQLSFREPFYRRLLCAAGVEERRAQLCALHGVGRKVADCVLLFALSHADIVPVDTHMAQEAAAYLSPVAAVGDCLGCSWQEVLRLWRSKAEANLASSTNNKPKKKEDTAKVKKPVKAKYPALTDKHHDAIQEGFRDIFGPHAGWAHSILFYNRMR